MSYECNFNTNIMWLDKRRNIADNDGLKRGVDCFKVIPKCNNRIIEIVFYRVDDASFGTMERKYSYLPMMQKRKKMMFDDGEIFIGISGELYVIGTYREV